MLLLWFYLLRAVQMKKPTIVNSDNTSADDSTSQNSSKDDTSSDNNTSSGNSSIKDSVSYYDKEEDDGNNGWVVSDNSSNTSSGNSSVKDPVENNSSNTSSKEDEEVGIRSLGNVFIMGDSYSTFKGHIPAGNVTYYGPTSSKYGITSVEMTWWHRLVTETKSKLVLNDSWSGSTICNVRGRGDKLEDRKYNSFVTRIDKWIKEGYFDNGKIDTFIIFGGTNDGWGDTVRGTPKYSDWTDADLDLVYPALCYILDRVKKTSPDTEMIVVINDLFGSDLRNNFITISNYYGAKYVLTSDVEKVDGHPTYDGMKKITQDIIDKL